MEISLFIMIFFSALGVLVVLYFYHFRYRALLMGPDRLRNALARTISGEEEVSDEMLEEGLQELESRLRRSIVAAFLSLAAILACCIILLILSTLPELTLALSGVCVFLTAATASLILLRDILRFFRRHLDEAGRDAGKYEQ